MKDSIKKHLKDFDFNALFIALGGGHKKRQPNSDLHDLVEFAKKQGKEVFVGKT